MDPERSAVSTDAFSVRNGDLVPGKLAIVPITTPVMMKLEELIWKTGAIFWPFRVGCNFIVDERWCSRVPDLNSWKQVLGKRLAN